MILRRVMEQRSYSLEQGRVEWEVWEDLGKLLDRKPNSVYERWVVSIEHVLTRYEAGETDKIPSKLLIQFWH